MAVNRADRYPGRWGTETTDYPLGVPKNRTSATSQDGSYFEKEWISDYEAFFGALMTDAGLTANGTADTATESQFINALRKTSYVENRFKGNQNWNVSGTDGEVTDTEQTFSTVDAEFSAGRYVATSLVDAKYDNGLFSATSGSYYIEYDGDFTDNFYGVKLDDGSITQTGCALSLVSGKTRLTVDAGVVGAHKFAGLSELVGMWPDISDNESEREIRGGFISNGAPLSLELYPDGWSRQRLSTTILAGNDADIATMILPVDPATMIVEGIVPNSQGSQAAGWTVKNSTSITIQRTVGDTVSTIGYTVTIKARLL